MSAADREYSVQAPGAVARTCRGPSLERRAHPQDSSGDLETLLLPHLVCRRKDMKLAGYSLGCHPEEMGKAGWLHRLAFLCVSFFQVPAH